MPRPRSMVKKERTIMIRCNTDTWRAFRRYVAENGFKTYEEALRDLLKKAGYIGETFIF